MFLLIYESSKVQKKMLDAVIAIEKKGINKNSVASFRNELASVASMLSGKVCLRK